MKIITTDETERFISGLDPKVEAKARKRIHLLQEYGHILRMPHSRYIMPNIFELRTIGKDNVRLIYTFRDNMAIIFHAYMKKTEEISGHEMNIIKQKFNSLHL